MGHFLQPIKRRLASWKLILLNKLTNQHVTISITKCYKALTLCFIQVTHCLQHHIQIFNSTVIPTLDMTRLNFFISFTWLCRSATSPNILPTIKCGYRLSFPFLILFFNVTRASNYFVMSSLVRSRNFLINDVVIYVSLQKKFVK